MSVKFTVKDDFRRIKAYVSATQKQIERAHLSALKSTANVVREALRAFVRGGGEGWRPLTTLTVLIRQGARRGKKAKLAESARTPYFWMSRFARYRLEGDDTARIRFGGGYGRGARKDGRGERTRKSDPDAFLDEVVKRMEQGERLRVTDKMRRRLGAVSGTGLKKDTHTITLPRRPAVTPVFRKVQGRIGPHYREKFFAALQRYQGGGEKARDSVWGTAHDWLRGD